MDPGRSDRVPTEARETTRAGRGCLVWPIFWLGAAALASWSCARTPSPRPGDAAPGQIDVRIVTDEPDAVLAILAARARGEPVTDAAWRRLFAAEGYARLKQRELSLGRAFTDSAFRAFVLSRELAGRAAALRRTLDGWRHIDVRAAAGHALAYLPAGTPLRARMYPEIKPAANSFVFETDTNPAIFVYVDPTRSAAQVQNTLSHELHHVGVSAACREQPDSARPAALRRALDWASGFDEGRAMLAAAGGPDVDPHATSTAAEHAVWDRNLALAPGDLPRLEAFFTDVLDGRLQGAELTRAGFSFINAEGAPQGPFYTVGWLMSVVVEKQLGRGELVASLCEPARFLADYDRAAAAVNRRGGGPLVRGAPAPLPLWSDSLLGRMGSTPAAR